MISYVKLIKLISIPKHTAKTVLNLYIKFKEGVGLSWQDLTTLTKKERDELYRKITYFPSNLLFRC